MNTTPLMRAALEAAERGWYVFPLRPGTKRPALHGEATCTRTGDCTNGHLKWEQRASTDPLRIRNCWETSAANIALATGPSGLVVVDLDMLKPEDDADTPDGETSFTALCERAGHTVPDTYRVRTPVAACTCTSPPRPASNCPAPKAHWHRKSTPAHGAATSSLRAASPPPEPTKPSAPCGGPCARMAAEHPATRPQGRTGALRARNGTIPLIR